MKRALALTVLILSFLNASSQDLSVRSSLDFAFQSEQIGLRIGGMYGITEVIDLAASFSYYIPRTEELRGIDGSVFEVRNNLLMLDVDGHYNFLIQRGFVAYPLAGVNLTNITSEFGNTTTANSYIGLNLGIGSSYDITERIAGFAEIKYIIGRSDQFVLGIGGVLTLSSFGSR